MILRLSCVNSLFLYVSYFSSGTSFETVSFSRTTSAVFVQESEKVLTNLLLRFIMRDVIKNARKFRNLRKIDFSCDKYSNEEVKIGDERWSLLSKFKVSDRRKTAFCDDCIKLFNCKHK